jgi:ATP-binding cassette, subfamily F, member 3
VIVVSHDRHLLGLIADRLVLVDGGTAKDFSGSLEGYRKLVLRSGNAAADGDGDGRAKRGNRKNKRRLAAELRESSKTLRKQVAEAEAEIKRLWQKRGEIDDMPARPSANGSSVAELMKARAEIERRLEGPSKASLRQVKRWSAPSTKCARCRLPLRFPAPSRTEFV